MWLKGKKNFGFTAEYLVERICGWKWVYKKRVLFNGCQTWAKWRVLMNLDANYI